MKIQIAQERRQHKSRGLPTLARISSKFPPRRRRSRPPTAATLAAPTTRFWSGRRPALYALHIRVRLLVLLVAAIAVRCAACSGDASRGGCFVGAARRPHRHVPAEAGLGTRGPRRAVHVGAAGRRGVGRTSRLQAGRVGRANRRTAGSLTVTLRSDVRFHTGEPLTAPVGARPSGEEARTAAGDRRRHGARRSAPGAHAAEAVVGARSKT